MQKKAFYYKAHQVSELMSSSICQDYVFYFTFEYMANSTFHNYVEMYNRVVLVYFLYLDNGKPLFFESLLASKQVDWYKTHINGQEILSC